jgi:hypothetical protein
LQFPLRRRTDAPELELSREHEVVAAPRRGQITWQAFDREAWPEAALRAAAADWRERARTEYCSLALFTQLASCVQRLGAPLDWAGAFARMIADEVRHAELSARMAETLGGSEPAAIDPEDLQLPPSGPTLRAQVRKTVIAVFCIGETLSGRMFQRCLRAATVPLARDVVRTIVDDETFHGRFGWEAAALLMRGDDDAFAEERAALARALPELFAHYRHACSADAGEAWARSSPEADPPPNFGTLTRPGYARAFYDGMREDVVPGLVAIGLPEAADAWRSVAG